MRRQHLCPLYEGFVGLAAVLWPVLQTLFRSEYLWKYQIKKNMSRCLHCMWEYLIVEFSLFDCYMIESNSKVGKNGLVKLKKNYIYIYIIQSLRPSCFTYRKAYLIFLRMHF